MIAETKKKITIGVLAFVIVLSYGFAIDSWLNPKPQYLGEQDRIAVEFMVDNACPFLKDKIEMVEGNMELDNAMWVIKECETHINAARFERVLIDEFSKHYE